MRVIITRMSLRTGGRLMDIKRDHKINLLIYGVILVIIVVLGLSVDHESLGNTPDYHAEKGLLNVEDITWTEGALIALRGEWLFYPQQLKQEITESQSWLYKSVPHFWEVDTDLDNSPYGFGTYRLKITGLRPNEILGFQILDQVTAYDLWANDSLVASNGSVGKNTNDYSPKWKPTVGIFQADKKGQVDLIMEVSNFSYYRGGFWNSIEVGSVDTVITKFNRNKLFDMFLFASIMIIGISNFIMFLLYRRRYNAMLYFSLFCFDMGARTMLIGHRLINDLIPNADWYLLVRLEYLFGYLLLPLFALFVISFFEPDSQKRMLKRIFSGLAVFFLITTLILPNRIYVLFLEPYKWFAILMALYFAFLVTKSAKGNSIRARVLVLIVTGFMIAIFKEVFIGGTLSWLPFATLNLIVCFSFLTFNQLMDSVKEKEVLKTKALHDHLTTLYNRNYITQLEGEDYFVGQNRYIIFMDLDSFKSINDTFGHDAGDYILKECSHRLKHLLRNSDILCRYGGDEFIIIIDHMEMNIDNITKIAGRIIKTIQEPIHFKDQVFNISTSLGISLTSGEEKQIDSTIKEADEAMYIAKNRGGGQFHIWCE